MPTKINHVAIVSEQFAMVSKFYEAVFGFKVPASRKLFSATTVGDGYVGININPRRPGRPAGLDHFGVEVDDVQEVLGKMARKYPDVQALKRPSNRPFAGLTTHDPDGNVFDLSQKDMKNRSEIYLENEVGWTQPRIVSHVAVRTLNPERMAEFYAEVLGLAFAPLEEGRGFCVTDGRMNLKLFAWDIRDYEGTQIIRPGPDHIGFTVEDLEAFKADVDSLAGANPTLSPKQVALGPEGKRRADMVARDNPGAHVMSDNDCITLVVRQASRQA